MSTLMPWTPHSAPGNIPSVPHAYRRCPCWSYFSSLCVLRSCEPSIAAPTFQTETLPGPTGPSAPAAVMRSPSSSRGRDLVQREPQAFDALFVSLIKVAEARGGVPETLHRLSRHYEARQSLIRQARSAMIYPLVVLVIALVVVALITIFLLPRFAEMLKDIAGRNATLPFPSRALMGS